MSRKDYGANAQVAESNETVKRANFDNSPYSVTSTGHNHIKDKYIPVTDENVEALVQGTRFMQGNREGYVKTVTDDGGDPAAFASAELAYQKDGEEVVLGDFTKAELLNMPNLFFATTD